MIILGTNSIKDTGFNVANSCRFNDGDSPSLTKTHSGAGNRRTFTISVWVKRSHLSYDYAYIFTAGTYNSTQMAQFKFDSNDQLNISGYASNGSQEFRVLTNQKFRDVSSFYHLIASVDTTQGTASNRVKLYINGTLYSGGFVEASYPSENYDSAFNSDIIHSVGIRNGTSSYYDGYMAELVMVDGSALAASSFGEFDEDSPQIFKPKDVSGLTFGTNGFYLDFEDSSALGNDAAGSNNFTANNLAATDQATDTCTNNFATLNPLFNSAITYSEGNLHYKNTHGSNSEFTLATIQEVSNGRWYWEIKMASTNNNSAYEYFGNGTAYVKSNGDIHPSGTTTVSNGDIFGFYLNYEDGQMTIHRNGSEVYQSSSGISLSTTTAQIAAFNNTEYQLNFGNPIFSISSGNADANGYGNFEYSPVLSSVNFYSLCTKNLAEFG
jgi:hypothetical protein